MAVDPGGRTENKIIIEQQEVCLSLLATGTQPAWRWEPRMHLREVEPTLNLVGEKVWRKRSERQKFADLGSGVGLEAGRVHGVGRKDIIKTMHFVKKKKNLLHLPSGPWSLCYTVFGKCYWNVIQEVPLGGLGGKKERPVREQEAAERWKRTCFKRVIFHSEPPTKCLLNPKTWDLDFNQVAAQKENEIVRNS